MSSPATFLIVLLGGVLVAAIYETSGLDLDNNKYLGLLFVRPWEPAFMPKNGFVFDVPREYVADIYKDSFTSIVSEAVANKFHRIKVKEITLPDLNFAKKLGRRDPFSVFMPWHQQIATRLLEIFMDTKGIDDFLSLALYCRDNLSPNLFIYVYSVAILHRPDTKGVHVPPLIKIFPNKFINGDNFIHIRERSKILKDKKQDPLTIPKDFTASDLEKEHQVAYFREDIAINLHHWHWHLVYPFQGPMEVVNKDRRGELFYYMHHQMMARYDLERFSNNLPRTKRLLNLRQPITEGYFPKLQQSSTGRTWPSRPRFSTLRDINREGDDYFKFDVMSLERWRERILLAIQVGAVIDTKGVKIPLNETGGIDILGNMMESSILSINRNLYGDLHNSGHIAIALCHDPDNRFLESMSVMGDTATAVRDPVFFRWHSMINDIFQQHKTTLPPYTVQELDFTDVRVSALEVKVDSETSPPKNELSTFWQQNDVELSHGLDFHDHNQSVYVRITHLQHAPFSYKITVENGGAPRQGTVRIFIGPKYDESGRPMLLRVQKDLFVQLDNFPYSLRHGKNTIERKSSESVVTIPFEQTFGNLEDSTSPCGCGWPAHMLLPKGTTDGMQFQLFAMLSDDKQNFRANYRGTRGRLPTKETGQCVNAPNFCGNQGKPYPDSRSMGYPFDRMPRNSSESNVYLTDFLTDNMRVQDVVIRFNNIVEPPKPLAPKGTVVLEVKKRSSTRSWA